MINIQSIEEINYFGIFTVDDAQTGVTVALLCVCVVCYSDGGVVQGDEHRVDFLCGSVVANVCTVL